MEQKATLYGLSYSPWTERARWALDHHHVTYQYREHTPFLGELLLRFRARNTGRKHATVPLLHVDADDIGDSLAIMKYADQVGQNTPLFPEDTGVEEWYILIEPALQALRRRVTRQYLASRDALREVAAQTVPRWMVGLATPIAAMGTKHIANKYQFDIEQDESHIPETVSLAFDKISEIIPTQRYLVGTFSAADILAATLLNAIQPVERPHLKLGPASRDCWTVPQLVDAHPDLLQWRDQLYQTHRFPS